MHVSHCRGTVAMQVLGRADRIDDGAYHAATPSSTRTLGSSCPSRNVAWNTIPLRTSIDTSKNKHATRHFHDTSHPIVASFEPGEEWRHCYVDEILV
jgi:hypothetical protein